MIDNPQTLASLSPAFADALQNSRHALLTEDPAESLARVLTTFHNEHRAEVLRDAEEICDEAGASYTAKALNDHAAGAYELMARFRRKAEEVEQTAVLPAVPVPPATHATVRAFVLWLDASDGSVPTHDGIHWPDGTATVHHRHFGHTTTHATPEAACQAAHGKQGRLVWPDAELRRVAAEAQQQEQPAGLEVTLVRVRNLHAPDANGHCGHCHRIHPCPTIDALDHDAEAQQQPDTEFGFVPPAAVNLPAGTLEAAEIGANRLDAWARTPQGRNFLAHALAQLARTGWLRTEPGEGFEPVRDRDETPAPEQPAPGPGRVADEGSRP